MTWEPTCCQCQAMEKFFDTREAQRELRTYRKRGPAKTTRLLVEALRHLGIENKTLLDIGGGIGAIQLALLADGVSSATDVDASQGYIETAREESAREGYGDRVTYIHGNFVDVASTLAPAGIVTLERVICCYPDMPALVGASAAKAESLCGLVYPRDTWWMRLGARVINATMWVQRSQFRFFVHSTAAVDAELRHHGLLQSSRATSGPWQVAVYTRQTSAI